MAKLVPTSDQAYQVLKANFLKLVNEIQPDIPFCDSLWSAGIINDEDHSFVCDEKKKTKQRARKLLFAAMQSIKSNYQHFETLCNYLEESDSEIHHQLASQLKDEVMERCHSESSSSSNKDSTNLKVLKDELSVLRKGILQSDENIEVKYDIMKEFIATFITTSLDASVPESEVHKQLYTLCHKEMIIPTRLIDWTFEELKRVAKKNQHSVESGGDSPLPCSPHSQRVLCTKEQVSSCLLLCKTVALCNRSNYSKFLAQHGHSFDEVSFSHLTGENTYVIAKTRKEFYVAFLGEPQLLSWQEKYNTFSEGIANQACHIPVRFFVEQIRNGYTIFFTGFSFGGLLALSVYASVWNETCLSISNLLQNVVCITFGLPLVPLEKIERTFSALPDMKDNSHLFMMKEDVVPRLLQFLEIKSSSTEKFSNKVGELIVKHLVKYAQLESDKATVDLSDLKTVLREKKIGQSTETKVFGTCHYIYTDSSGVKMTQLATGAARESLSIPDIAELGSDIITQHALSKYETSLLKVKFLQASEGPTKSHTDVGILKPEVTSITFYRHGDEIALVLRGKNLWFCSKIKITSESGSCVIDTLGADATSRSVHFNYIPKNEHDLLIGRNDKSVDVVFYSHFASSIRRKVPVEFKGEYHVSYRQRQLARLTPDQVITISFLSALLECTIEDKPSRRYKTICQFLEDVVRIVPLESIFHAIAFGSDENVWRCAEAFLSTNVTIPPSTDLSVSLGLACSRLTLGVNPSILVGMQRQALYQHFMTNLGMGMIPVPVDMSVHVGEGDITCTAYPVESTHSSDAAPTVSYQRLQSLTSFQQQSVDSASVIAKLQKLKIKVDDLCMKKYFSGKPLRVICNLNIEELYPAKSHDESVASSKLQSPISVLKNGREALHKLQKEAEEEIFQVLAEGEDMKEFYNEKMIAVLHKIFDYDLSFCSFVLGAFMQQQIRVPLVDSCSETAHILQTTEAPPAVGVWALFCLDMIDFEAIMKKKKGKALVVNIEKYVKGIFAKGSDQRQQWQDFFPEQLYAGKLQFLMQCLISSVSCNTSYISYSLESQLAELCESRNIKPTTRVQTLVSNWEQIFKDNVLCHVMQSFRPIVARWIIWCLSIHHLREELASHTTVGIVGLSNSGKSSLVKSLFKQKVIAGTTTMQRTTVPFLYNLEGLVDGLSVIDFPGVDDRNDIIVEISKILLQISQLVILVVEYKQSSTKSVSQWVEILKNSGVPVLVCLTHADKLYATTCLDDDGKRKYSNDDAKRLISQELEKIREKLDQSPNWKVDFFSFNQDSDSCLNSDEGRQVLADVGISFGTDVGLWIETELRDYMKLTDIADRLKKFLSSENSPRSTVKANKAKILESICPVIRGVDIVAETSFVMEKKGDTFTWNGYGLQIVFPPDAISDATCTVHAKVISSGQYELPENTALASSLYCLYSPRKFLKPVDVRIQHCCPPNSSNKRILSFVKGRCDQDLPYKFKLLDGSFSSNDQKGLISLHSFCLLGIVETLQSFVQPSLTDSVQIHPNTGSMMCVIRVFSKAISNGIYNFEFVFMKDLESFDTAITEKYSKEDGWMRYTEETIEFDDASLSLNVQEGTDMKDWTYVKRNSGKIKRNIFYQCQPRSCPCCCLEFRWSHENPPISVSCPVEICVGSEQLILTVVLPPIQMTSTAQEEFCDNESSITSSEAIKILQDAGFRFATSFTKLLVELEIETEDKKRLKEQALLSNDYMLPLEEALDIWIANKNSSWSLFILAVSKCEKNTAEKMKELLKSHLS